MTPRTCANCLTSLETAEERCPVCLAFADGRSGALTLLDDLARDLIGDLGGAREIVVFEPQRSHVVVCETGMLRFDAGRGVVWFSKRLGALSSTS